MADPIDDEQQAREAGIKLFAIQRELLVAAHDQNGRYFLRDDDPQRSEKRSAIVALCDLPKPLFRRAGFRSSRTDGGFYFELTELGADVARVVGAS